MGEIGRPGDIYELEALFERIERLTKVMEKILTASKQAARAKPRAKAAGRSRGR